VLEFGKVCKLLMAIELIVLGAALWPLYRLLYIPMFRTSHRRIALLVTALAVMYAICVIEIAINFPELLHVLALVALVALIFELWRSRKRYGTNNRLPPGSLTLVPRAPWSDHRFYQKQFMLHGPVFKMSHGFRPVVCVLGPERGLDLIRRHGDALGSRQMRFSRFIPRGFLRFMAPHVHTYYKPRFQAAFARTTLEKCHGSITQAIRSELAQMAEASAHSMGKGIRLQPHFSNVLLAIFARTVLGIPSDSTTFAKLTNLYSQIDMQMLTYGSSSHVVKVANEIAEIIHKQGSSYKRMIVKEETPPPCFLAEMLRKEPDSIDDPTIVLNYVYMVQTGFSDLVALFVWIVKLLSENSEWTDRLREEIDSQGVIEVPGSRTLAGRMVQETLRLEQSELIGRTILDTFEFDGYVFPKGWLVRICIREGHRDPDIFEEPESFNPDRFLTRTYTAAEYSPLGLLTHSCLAGHLVGVVSRAFIVNLVGNYHWTTTQDGPREFGRWHWQPSSAFRINLQPRSSSGNHTVNKRETAAQIS